MNDKALRKTFMEQKRASADRVKEAKKVGQWLLGFGVVGGRMGTFEVLCVSWSVFPKSWTWFRPPP